ncbi:hypothetical protein [Bacillus sp. SA1-12]|nr:hypothetical protein [Bacillus sp. SA1-12]
MGEGNQRTGGEFGVQEKEISVQEGNWHSEKQEIRGFLKKRVKLHKLNIG